MKPKPTKEPSKPPETLVETPPSSSKSGSQPVTTDDVWLTVADGQANIFERINHCFRI